MHGNPKFNKQYSGAELQLSFHARGESMRCPETFLMEWVNKISRIVVLNLPHREDRLLQFAEMADEYSIPFERVSAIYNEQQGAAGLRDTMIEVFKEAIENKRENVLIFEDDAIIIVGVDEFNLVMNNVMEQLPENYHMVFLGCQLTSNGCKFHSANLIRVQKSFSTHAVLYSLQGMKEIMAREFGYPIDNWYVEAIQPMNESYCTNPFLVSQRFGYSDIGKRDQDWRPFLEQRFDQQIANIRR